MTHFEKAIQYVRENRTWSEAEEAVALERINSLRSSIGSASSEIAMSISDLMEEYGAENDLPEGSSTVGAHISTSHIKPSKMSATVKATAVLKGIEGRKLTFRVSACDDDGLIGEGTHVRYIVDIQKFMSKIK